MMTFQRIVLLLVVLAFLVAVLVIMSGCMAGETENTRWLDAQGNPINQPPGGAKYERRLPGTGRPLVDYAVGGITAAVLGVLGYYTRRVKVEGHSENVNLVKRVELLESPPAGGNSRGTTGFSADDLRRLSRFLDFEARMENGKPSADGTAQ